MKKTTRNSKVIGGILALGLVLSLTMTNGRAAGVPSSKATFQTSDLVLIPQTSGTSDWVTVLSALLKTPQDKDLFISGSLEAGAFTQADSEFDRCIKRRGEAQSLFLDEEPTYGYLPPVYYYQGRVREGLKNAGFAESYRTYLSIRGQSKEDPLLPEVRRHVGR